jgi:HrpA-like RNA helicase
VSQILLNDASERGQKIKVVATLGNGLSAKEFANFIASERHEKITTTVGYQDKLESQVAPMSILTFCLNEILLRTLMGNDSILSCLTHIIVDGVDQNDRFCDLLLLVLSEALTRYKMLKLIILSHADSPNAFKTYFPQFVPLALNEPFLGLDSLGMKAPDEVNFQVLCLYAKVFARSGFPFADYLARMSNPPPFQTTRTNIQALKIMEALNNLEDITELGNHLLDLPVEPHLGKMILYAVSLKCLDPVLTIVACLSYRCPLFIGGEGLMKSKACLSEESQSDHMTLLRAFQGWQESGNAGDFCTGYNLSQEALESIFYGRSLILGHLRASGFVRAKGPGDIKDLNVNSENWAIIKAALTAGLYPNVAFQPSYDQPICAHKFGPVNIDNQDSVLVQNSLHHWYVFDERKENRISGVTVVSPITIFLFAGHNRLPSEFIQEATQGNNMNDELSDSENDDPEEANNSAIRIDDWISFQSDSTLIQSLVQLRQKWSALFLRRLKTPGKPLTQDDDRVISSLVSLLSEEEQSNGISQPSGIGKRPKHFLNFYI